MNVTMQMLLLLRCWQQRAQMMLMTIFRTRPIDPRHRACSCSSMRRLALLICITHVVQYKFHFALFMWVCFICAFVSRGGVAELSTALHYDALVALSFVKCAFGRGGLRARVPAHGAGRGGRICAGDIGICVVFARRLRVGPRGHPSNARPKSNARVQSASCKPVVSSGVLRLDGPLPPLHPRSVAVKR